MRRALNDYAVQIHDKSGVVRGSEIESLFQRLRMFRILTGSSEIQKNGIARQSPTTSRFRRKAQVETRS
ncbi:acyl-CoA dehydrogenase family protein [Rhodococcus sp. APC 3903]|nr:acyl-CoA dehydrogenase family protein [Rhodococcus sp. APC 3903]MDN3460674.1 acyl-CoA dehydrogenase family protein [Rhodococcus sp. APC 3903]